MCFHGSIRCSNASFIKVPGVQISIQVRQLLFLLPAASVIQIKSWSDYCFSYVVLTFRISRSFCNADSDSLSLYSYLAAQFPWRILFVLPVQTNQSQWTGTLSSRLISYIIVIFSDARRVGCYEHHKKTHRLRITFSYYKPRARCYLWSTPCSIVNCAAACFFGVWVIAGCEHDMLDWKEWYRNPDRAFRRTVVQAPVPNVPP